jgi:hypothetical protein
MTVGSTKIVRTMCPMNCHPTFCGMLVEVEGGKLKAVKLRTAGNVIGISMFAGCADLATHPGGWISQRRLSVFLCSESHSVPSSPGARSSVLGDMHDESLSISHR